jgi:F420-dependent oxidoreductase-like protein
MTQIGIMIEGQEGLNWTRWQRILQAAEDFRYQCVFRSDHFTNPHPPDKDSLELWVSLTYAASHTKRIEFGSCVTPVTFRHPSMTVRMAAQVDDLSDGRLILGMGAGWQDREHHNFGIPFYDFDTRFEMLEDALEVTKQLLESDSPVTYQGKHFSLDGAILLPHPQRKTPIMIGGNGPKKTLPLAAQYADEWNGVFISHFDYHDRNQHLNELLKENGRDPGSVKRSLMTQIIFGKDDNALDARLAARGHDRSKVDELTGRGLIVGTPSAVIDQLSAFVEAGVQRFMLQWLDLDDIDGLEQIANDVLPHFHQAAATA